MHRFRKKSDAKRGHLSQDLDLSPQGTLPQLPPTNDFRTSLILPDLSRRFSLLRSATGDQASLDSLRTRLANQRARGGPTQISEEEEDMFLETLGRLRSRATPSPGASQEHIVDDEDGLRSSVRSTGTATSSVTSSPGRSAKRYSNNMFGSGRLRDYSYLKSAGSSKGSGSVRTISMTPTEGSTRDLSNTSPRPVTPEGHVSSSVQSSPNEQGSVRSAPFVPPAPFSDNAIQAISLAETRLQKTLGPAVLKRASMAIEQALKEMEDEVEDEILLPRSVPVPRGSLDQPATEVRHSHASYNSTIYESGMAISIDKTIHDEFSERRASPIPARTVPGYVPGMPRPMTPRDFDFDEQRSHSTTPRAQSPFVDASPTSVLSNISTSKLRRESVSSAAKSTPITPVAVAPLFLQRSTNGRYTPTSDDSHRGSGDSIDFGDGPNLSILARRRPASPLSSPPYQPMAVSTNRSPSRPTTPSNVIWTPNPNHGHKSNHSSHSRNNSWTVDNIGGSFLSSDLFGSLGQSNPHSRSPANHSDTQAFDFSPSAQQSFASMVKPTNGQAGSADEPHAYIPDVDVGSPLLASAYALRSDTPTQNTQRSPISPTFSSFDLSPRHGGKRSSRQNTPSSPFNISTFPSLGYVPRANSSRSSLDSVGSSFHSWDETDKVLKLFSNSAEPQPSVVWHDFDSNKSESITTGEGSPDEDDWDPEEVIQRYAGLKKGDIASMQEKLVTAAFTKIANTDPRDRAPSALRRRRPSTSQSNYPRIASPPPQSQPPSSPSPYVVDEQFSKASASALLNSVIDSIKDQPTTLDTDPITTTSLSADDRDFFPGTRRNRDLAHVLFGTEDDLAEDDLQNDETIKRRIEPSREPVPTPASASVRTPLQDVQPTTPSATTTIIATSTIEATENRIPTATPSPYLLRRNPSVPRIPQTPQEEADLTREVQKKADAAMLALNKNPSHVNLGDGLKHTTSVRRRVDPSQISTPKLVSTTTSVETIPLRSPSLSSNNPGSSKLGSRFRKLRGSLRAKNLVSSGEETVTPDTTKSPPASQLAHYDPAMLDPPGVPKISSATEAGRFKVSVPNPPASAGPGLKGFMARFRNKQRMSEMAPGVQSTGPRATSPLSPVPPLSPAVASPLTPRYAEPTTPKSLPISSDRSLNLAPRQSGQPRPMYSRFPPASTPAQPQAPAEPLDGTKSAHLEQLFSAANKLGLDENALSDLLARSESTASRNVLSKNTANATPPARSTEWNDIQQVTYVASTSSDQTATPTNYGNSLSESQARLADARPVTPVESLSRKTSTRKPDHVRRPREGLSENAANAVVRRTIIYANDSTSQADLATLVQRKNSTRKRRVSAGSASARSVHDRAPTPPPPKGPTAKRFSSDGLPPMPQMPNLFGHADKMLNAPSTSASGPIEKSNSTYDSLYDMYSGESRVASMFAAEAHAHADQQPMKGESAPGFEPGPALEVIQLANGETIWNIVNGLRDGDDESIYSGRASFASEYSTREPGSDGLQFVKEHSRSASKGSVSSFVSKKKPPVQQGKTRPETKVFYSSSAQISRLIESLSQGADAGSFNFIPNVPNRTPGHSASSSVSTNDINWTVEERLDRMLGAMNKSSS